MEALLDLTGRYWSAGCTKTKPSGRAGVAALQEDTPYCNRERPGRWCFAQLAVM